jgi:Ca2+-binding RTX toxin-like protein
MRSRLLVACAVLLSALAFSIAPSMPAAASVAVLCNELAPTQPPLLAPGTLLGTAGDDVLIGSTGDDVIKGGGGFDTICGGLGSDRIEGGYGHDDLFGEGGYSYDCPPGVGDDLLLGGPGDDFIWDVCGDNTAHGDAGADQLAEVSGTADGGSGNDQVFAEDGFFTCGAAHRDCITGHARGGSGNDIVGVEGGDADGGSGVDHVVGDWHGDEVRGGSSADTVVDPHGWGDLTLDGGSGRDTCDAAAGDVLVRCEVVT